MVCLKFLFLAAMPAELLHVNNAFGITPSSSSTSIGCSIVHIVETGIGMVHASSMATYAINLFKPDVVINTGCAGAHVPYLSTGDVVIGSEYIPLSHVIMQPNQTIDYYGVRMHNDETVVSWRADESLLDIATSLHPSNIGRIGSYDAWVNEQNYISKIHSKFQTLCEDMEAAAIAQVCHAFNTPFISIKDISNSVYEEERHFDANNHIAPEWVGKNAANIAKKIFDEIHRKLE